jgi:hypothetical protein
MKFILDGKGYQFIRELGKYARQPHIEFEIRIGERKFGKEFKPSISKSIFEKISQSQFFSRIPVVYEESVVESFENGRRITFPSQSNRKPIIEKKNIIERHDITYYDFTLRIALSSETPIVINTESELGKIQKVRHRKRRMFKFDQYITYVLTEIDDKDRTYEFEIEFSFYEPDFIRNCLVALEYSVSQVLPFFSNDNDLITYIPLDKQEIIRQSYKKLAIRESKPVNIHPSNLLWIRQHEYSVTNKLDGERFVIIFNSYGVYALNHRIVDQLSPKRYDQISILDTERFDKFFYVFDCMKIDGKDITQTNHSNRLKEAVKILGENSFLPLRMKNFYFITDTQNLLEGIKQKDYKNNDGIIYTPNTEYYSKYIYKWKFPEKMSIDFKVKKNENGENGYYLYDSISLPQHSQPHTKTKLNDHLFKGSVKFPLENGAFYTSTEQLRENSIHEFTYDISTKQFVRLRERMDKENPNFCTVAIDVWNDINEPFTEEKLISLLSAPLHELENIQPKDKIECDFLGDRDKDKDDTEEISGVYRRYHNKIKKGLIDKYCENRVVLDLGIGRGGDLAKYKNVNVWHLFGIEPNLDNLAEFIQDVYFGGDMNAAPALAGQSAGLIHEVKSVQAIIEDTVAEFHAIAQRMGALSTGF